MLIGRERILMREKMKCPCCNKRALDILIALGNVVIEMKCPHCRNIVEIKYNK